MIIMDLHFDNVLCFKNFDINFSYPIKLRTSLIKNETLSNVPSFRFKKLNIFVGSNASGKTSLIKAIWKTLLFLNRKDSAILLDLIDDVDSNSFIKIDLVANKKSVPELHRFKIKFKLNEDNEIKALISHKFISMNKNSSTLYSYENLVKKFDEEEDKYVDYIEALKDVDFIFGWKMILPATESSFDEVNFAVSLDNEILTKDYLKIANKVFKTLDNSIIHVSKSSDANNALVLERINGKNIIIQEKMKITSIPFLSSGTKYGVNIVNMIYSIKLHRNGIYLFDEQFSYLNADIERAILCAMVDLLGDDEQLFFTTHNSEILTLGYPFHSFNFLKKEILDGKQYVTALCASSIENRNNVAVKSILDNDIFGITPKIDEILNIGNNDA